MPKANDYETLSSAQYLAQDLVRYGGSDSAQFNGSTEPANGCSGRLDPTGWDGAEDTDPTHPALDLSQFDAPREGGRMGFAMWWDAGTPHPDLPMVLRVEGLL